MFAPVSFIPIGIDDDSVNLVIKVNLDNYDEKTYNLRVNIIPTQDQETMNTAISLGTPSLLFLAFIGLLWVRIFSVPKRLRQINGQIKALRKGKMPKPIITNPKTMIVSLCAIACSIWTIVIQLPPLTGFRTI